MKKVSLVLGVFGAALLGSGAVFAAPGSAGAYYGGPSSRDARISRRVAANINHEIKLKHEAGNVDPQVSVRTRDGVVTLSGNVWTTPAENHILQEAQNTPGVAAVRNRLNVPI